MSGVRKKIAVLRFFLLAPTKAIAQNSPTGLKKEAWGVATEFYRVLILSFTPDRVGWMLAATGGASTRNVDIMKIISLCYFYFPGRLTHLGPDVFIGRFSTGGTRFAAKKKHSSPVNLVSLRPPRHLHRVRVVFFCSKVRWPLETSPLTSLRFSMKSEPARTALAWLHCGETLKNQHRYLFGWGLGIHIMKRSAESLSR